MFFVFELDMNSSFLILIAFFYMDPSILIISQPDQHPPINYHSRSILLMILANEGEAAWAGGETWKLVES
jgi:hypothetical protein